MSSVEMQSYYAARAGEYDAIYRKPERQADLRDIEAWLPGHFTGRRVIDIACGTGHWTRFIATTASHVLGVDAARETLAIARTRVPPDKATFIVGDAWDLTAAAAASGTHAPFDAAFAGFWFSHVPIGRRLAFLRGVHRVVAPGAPVVLIDNRYVEGSSTPISEVDTDAEGNTFQRRPLADGSVHRVMKNFPTPDELHALAAASGTAGTFRQWRHFWSFTCPAPGAGDPSDGPTR